MNVSFLYPNSARIHSGTYRSAALILFLWLISLPSYACIESATSDIEKLYCQVVAKGEGVGLPSFDDFRRNPEQTQRLLLTRPAKRAGLTMPKAANAKPAQPKEQAQRSTASEVLAKPVQKIEVPTSLKGCVVTNSAIHCGNHKFDLLDNRSNNALAIDALSSENTLSLPPTPDYRSNLELHNYLQQAYEIYLTKMDAIGLAGATLSYSKFYYIFDEALTQQQDFVKRFANMYVYLKKDKSEMAVARQHKNNPAPALAMCEPIGYEFIVCDTRGSNWVYRRKQ